MKTVPIKKFNLCLAAVFYLILSGWGAAAAPEKFTRTISKQYDVNSDALLSVTNKFGKIHIENWDKKVVSIDVTITVEARSEEKANRIFDDIRIDISGTSSRVEAQTEISDRLSGGGNGAEFSIDYMISMPSSLQVSLENKFGDIYLDQVDGPATVDLGYGNLEAKSFSNGDNNLTIKFSTATLDHIKGGEIDIKYSTLNLGDAGELTIESKFSTMNLESLNEGNIESKYDNYSIKKINAIDSESGFTSFTIGTLTQRGKMDTQYGGIEIDFIPSGFDEVIVTNSFGDVDLTFAGDASFRVDASMKFGSLHYPRDLSDIKTTEEGYTSTSYVGTIGKQSNPEAMVHIESQNASASIKLK